MKLLIYIARFIVGIVFIFSGTVKAIDPAGSVIKFQDYFSAFGLTFLNDLSLLFTILLCTAEFLAGISVLFNIRFRQGTWLVIIMMSLFTPLTLVLALTNPVSDCGCFGDAIVLTNWETFLKNIILLIPSIWLFLNRKRYLPEGSVMKDITIAGSIALLFIMFLLFNLRYLPVIDFRPYKTGTYIPDQMVIPEGKPVDKYETTFIYEKDGVQKEFDLTNYPADDTAWKFVDQKSVLVSKGYEPPIHDFILTNLNNIDITDQILSSDNYTVLMVARKVSETDPALLEQGYALGRFCKDNSIDFYILTSSASQELSSISNDHTYLMVDEITLKTMIRSNPGYLMLKKGTILHKWSWAGLPGEEEILQIILNNKN
ncbi:MAG TPA: DoxX family protein [Bacteroidales bacterium]|nr:DoxX family protein [Bacteroidales bacterium]HPJ58400.1 DoxX family protein [Bacteroidales bacterium]HPR10794.1 DoxX family protein [Bacteroidales bacterium]